MDTFANIGATRSWGR